MLLGVLPAALGCAGLWGLWLWTGVSADRKSFDLIFWLPVGMSILGWCGALALWIAGLRALRNADFRDYDSRDPDRRGWWF